MYQERPPPRQPEEEPYGCLETLLIVRVVLGIIMWPLLAVTATMILVGGAVILFTIHPALILIPIAIAGVAVYLFSRWERDRRTPPPPPF